MTIRGSLALTLLLSVPAAAQELPSPPPPVDTTPIVSGSLGVSIPVKKQMPIDRPGSETQGEASSNARLFGSVRVAKSGLFATATFFRYLDDDLQAPWDPDFVYSFGYDDWRPGTFSLVYANYTGNRFDRDRDAERKRTRFDEGTITAGYKVPLPRRLQSLFLLHESGFLNLQLRYTLTPRYFDLASLERRQWKQAASLTTRFGIFGGLYAEGAYVYYPKGVEQQPWDPDYTYGFGYYNWRPHTLSVFYSNYAGNRFRRVPGRGRFIDGSVTVAYGW